MSFLPATRQTHKRHKLKYAQTHTRTHIDTHTQNTRRRILMQIMENNDTTYERFIFC